MRTTGPILTETRKDVLNGEYDAPTRQAKEDHRQSIRENTKGALDDFQYLFKYLDQDELEEIFGEGYRKNAGVVSRQEHRDPNERLGWLPTEFFTEYFDDEGRPRDPEYNPDAQTEFESFLEKVGGENKASPDTQRALIDCVALLCRAAEAGELNVSEMIERGVERYYRGHPSKGRRMAALESWREDRLGKPIVANSRGSEHTLSVPGRAQQRYLAREGHLSD